MPGSSSILALIRLVAHTCRASMANVLSKAGFYMNGTEHFKAEHRLATAIESEHTWQKDYFHHCLEYNKASSKTFSYFISETQFAALRMFMAGI